MTNLSIGDVLNGLPWPVEIVRNLDAELVGLRAVEQHATDENTLLIRWGYGIGAAFSSGAVVVNRDRGRFCEIGHWSLGNARGLQCTCGNRDCLETVAALWALGPYLSQSFPEQPLGEKASQQNCRNSTFSRMRTCARHWHKCFD